MKYEKLVNSRWESYNHDIDMIAREAFHRVIRPYMEKYHLVFLSGNGTYYVGYTDKTPKWYIEENEGYYRGSIDIDNLPDKMRNILAIPMPGMSVDLGAIMPEYDPR